MRCWASPNSNQLKASPTQRRLTDQWASELLAFSHELFNIAYDALEFIDEI
jgi:hypothetical protein